VHVPAAATLGEEARASLSGEEPALWRSIAAALQLTAAQRADVLRQ